MLLKFAENYWTAVGQREFNVAINGTGVLTNFDILAAAGGSFKAIDKTFAVTVTNGVMTIELSAGTVDNPKVNAIQITPASGVPAAPTNLTATAGSGRWY